MQVKGLMAKESKKSFDLSSLIDKDNYYHWYAAILAFLGIVSAGAVGAALGVLAAHWIIKFTRRDPKDHVKNVFFCLGITLGIAILYLAIVFIVYSFLGE